MIKYILNECFFKTEQLRNQNIKFVNTPPDSNGMPIPTYPQSNNKSHTITKLTRLTSEHIALAIETKR